MGFNDKLPNFVGFNSLFDQFDKVLNGELAKKTVSNWPPYNVKKTGEGKYEIEVACAGFTKSDIEVVLDGNTLSVKGETKPTDGEYLHKGIADRSFTRTFTLADNVKVVSGEVVNGMLKIMLDAQVAASKLLKIDLK